MHVHADTTENEATILSSARLASIWQERVVIRPAPLDTDVRCTPEPGPPNANDEARRMPGLICEFDVVATGQLPSRQVAAVMLRLPMTDRQYLPAWGGSECALAQYVRDELK